MTSGSRPTSRLPSPRADESQLPELPEFDLVSVVTEAPAHRTQTEFLGGANALIPEDLDIENEYW